jgi:hypothetical protein
VRSLLRSLVLAIASATLLAGCARFFVDWDNGAIRDTAETPQQAAIPMPTPSGEAPHKQASNHPHKHKQPTSPDSVEQMTIEPDSTGNSSTSAPSEATTISMTAPGDSSGNAEKAIAATSDRLARFDRTRLKGETLSTYDQASGFLSQGKQALADKDYVAALGFAQKASLLADKLQTR